MYVHQFFSKSGNFSRQVFSKTKPVTPIFPAFLTHGQLNSVNLSAVKSLKLSHFVSEQNSKCSVHFISIDKMKISSHANIGFFKTMYNTSGQACLTANGNSE